MTSPRRLLAAAFVALLVLATFLGFRENPNDTGIVAPTPITADVQPAEVLLGPIGEFPEEELRSALTEVCSTGMLESADKERTQEEIDEQIDAFNELELSLSERLSVSSSAEHLHLAALLEDNPALRVELLDRAISRSPRTRFWFGALFKSALSLAMPRTARCGTGNSA